MWLKLGRLLLVIALLAAAPPPLIRHVTYWADPSDFANPERGFSKSKGPGVAANAAGLTLVHMYFRLDGFRDQPLPPSFLATVAATFADARASGIKLAPRFTYNFPNGKGDPRIDKDAPLARVLQHLDQLARVLRENADVIAFMEAGFVGRWGEWHDSTSGLDSVDAERAILDRLLAILPPTRDLVLRYERDKRAIFARDTPITPREAFSGVAIARVGHHNDCFLAAADDWGTYHPTAQRSTADAKAYLAAENRFVPQGGETCNVAADAQPFIGCHNALRSLADQHWSQLNADYHPGVLGLWKRQGCYGQIARRLGYRFRLLKSDYPASVRQGGVLSAAIDLVNGGFAAPYNPRLLELVLRENGGREIRLPIAADPRRWLPGTTIHLRLSTRLPSGLRKGTYTAFLALPDPEPRLRSRPQYAIRLANLGAWQPGTGDNALGWQIAVR